MEVLAIKLNQIAGAHFSAETDHKQDGNNRAGEGRVAHVGAAQVRIRITAALAPPRCKITAARRLHSIHSNFFTPHLE